MSLRTAEPADRDLAFRTFANARSDEFAAVAWTPAQIEALLRQQFEAQDLHYRTSYPSSESLVIVEDTEAIGRLYLDRAPREIRLLDIALLPEHRGRGIGQHLLEQLQEEAIAAGIQISLHVEKNNPARRLYARLGFVEVERGPIYDRLEWRPSLTTSNV